MYEQYYVDQAKQKGGNLPAFHGGRFQRGYGLGSIFKGLFRWALSHLEHYRVPKCSGKKLFKRVSMLHNCKMCSLEKMLKQQQKSALNKLWTYLPKIPHTVS